MARGLAEITKGTNVRVNSLLPGPTWTGRLFLTRMGRGEKGGSGKGVPLCFAEFRFVAAFAFATFDSIRAAGLLARQWVFGGGNTLTATLPAHVTDGAEGVEEFLKGIKQKRIEDLGPDASEEDIAALTDDAVARQYFEVHSNRGDVTVPPWVGWVVARGERGSACSKEKQRHARRISVEEQHICAAIESRRRTQAPSNQLTFLFSFVDSPWVANHR